MLTNFTKHGQERNTEMRTQFYSIKGSANDEVVFGKGGATLRSKPENGRAFGRLTRWISKKTGWYQRHNRKTRRAYFAELKERFQLGNDKDAARIFSHEKDAYKKPEDAPLLIQDIIDTEHIIRQQHLLSAVEGKVQAIQNGRTKLNQIKFTEDSRRHTGAYKWQEVYSDEKLSCGETTDPRTVPRHQETIYINDLRLFAVQKIRSLSDEGILPSSKDEIEILASDVASVSQIETVDKILGDIAQESEDNLCFSGALNQNLGQVLNLKLLAPTVTGMDRHEGKNFGDFIGNLKHNPEHEKALTAKILSLSEDLLQDPSATVGDIHEQVETEIGHFVDERSASIVREFHEILQAGKDSPVDTLGNIVQWTINQKTEQENFSIAGIGSACVSLTEGIKHHGSAEGASAMINELAEQQFKQSQCSPAGKAAFMKGLASAVSFVLEKEGMGEFIEGLGKEEPPEAATEVPSGSDLIPDDNEEEPSLFDQLPNVTEFLPPPRQGSFTTELLEAWNSNTAS